MIDALALLLAFHLVGDVRPRHLAWAEQSKAPLPPVTITLVLDRDPFYEYETQTLSIPKAGTFNWTFAFERLEFYHELGHAFDYALLRPKDRIRFRHIVGTDCRWRQDPCRTINTRCGCGQILNVPPAEMFAEEYAALSFGITHEQVEDLGMPTYGWNPPAGTEDDLQSLIEEVAAR